MEQTSTECLAGASNVLGRGEKGANKCYKAPDLVYFLLLTGETDEQTLSSQVVTNPGQRLKPSKGTERNAEEGLPARGLGSGALNSVVRGALPLVVGFEWKALPMSQGIDFQSVERLVQRQEGGKGLGVFQELAVSEGLCGMLVYKLPTLHSCKGCLVF